MMFSRQATLSAGGAIAVAIFVGIGCGNNVMTNDGSGGGKSGSTTVVTNATVTHSATTSVGPTSTTAGGGGSTPCDQACAKAAGCGFDICAQIPLSCGVAVEACAANCINNADCTAIQSIPTQMPNAALVGCLVGCQQGGTGGAGGGGATCPQCVQQQGCIPAGCIGNTDCQTWAACALQCGNQGPNCFDACDTATPTAASFYNQFYSCACTNCDTKCAAPMDPCGHVQNGSTGSASSSNVAASSGTN